MSELQSTSGPFNPAPWPDPTPDMVASPEFEAIWQRIKSWDISVPEVYGGYCGATGNHVRAILDALRPALEPPLVELLNELASLQESVHRWKAAIEAARYCMPTLKTYATNLARVPGGAVAAVDLMQRVHTFRELDIEGQSVPDSRFPGGKQP